MMRSFNSEEQSRKPQFSFAASTELYEFELLIHRFLQMVHDHLLSFSPPPVFRDSVSQRIAKVTSISFLSGWAAETRRQKVKLSIIKSPISWTFGQNPQLIRANENILYNIYCSFQGWIWIVFVATIIPEESKNSTLNISPTTNSIWGGFTVVGLVHKNRILSASGDR